MPAKQPNLRAQAWPFFDRIVADAAPDGVHSNPWRIDADEERRFEADYATLELLLGVPLHLKAPTQSGIPALAIDVWLSYELRRAGFHTDHVWPRPTNPRILPAAVAALLKWLPGKLRGEVAARVTKAPSIPGVTAASAVVLGKNYPKQVDVVLADWDTGPELLISTKRMDSSYANNAPNRVEESYGDAKNLRLRHPLAALGFVLGLRSDVLDKPNTAAWLFDLLAKLGQEDDAYHATCVILMEYADAAATAEADSEPSSDGILEPGPRPEATEDIAPPIPEDALEQGLASLPKVTIRSDKTPDNLAPERFLASMVTRVLRTTPINMHVEARRRQEHASSK